MSEQNSYLNNPLHGIGLAQILTELVEHYDFEILYAYLGLNCFKTKPSIASSVKFLKKTDWAREKLESFYLYQYKNLPKADDIQFQLPPRMRIVPAQQKPKAPAELSFEDAERLRQKKAVKTRARQSNSDGPWG